MFTPLHVYTGSSLLKSGIKIDEYLKYASKLNFNNLAISDFETFRGVPHFVHECQKYNIKPIIGIDLIIEGLLFTFFIKNVPFKNTDRVARSKRFTKRIAA